MRFGPTILTAILVAAFAAGAWSTGLAARGPTPTRGGLTIDEWRDSANFHARELRELRSANRRAVALSSAGVVQGFNCIHHYEGAWTDDGAPHWGGLQMDEAFMRRYAPELLERLGTANRWPPVAQIAVAIEAYYSGRGFRPWPNTRRMCGV